MSDQYAWWQRGVIYHVYPRSFQDSDGDGVGDLNGITHRLDYLRGLGVDALWISPIYPSPMADFGYDITNYTGIDPLFGTLADFDRLLAAAHARGLRVLLDWVPNHTADRHPWFLESRSSRSSPKRDWYLWRDAAPGGGPPTNWVSMFGGSAWEWDATTGQYYYHTYLREQPDLNWRNPDVQDAMLSTLRFWLERGVDGFRIDALRQVIKDDQYRDNPLNPDYHLGMRPYAALLPLYTTNRPEIHAVIRRVRETVDAFGGDRPLIGELYLPIDELVRYYGAGGSGLQIPANFHLLTTPWDARSVAALVDAYEAALPAYGWPNWVLSNHDNPRLASRIGPAQARVAALLLLTLRGTPTLYYGDELGMRDVAIAPSQRRDPVARNLPGLGLGRDPERTPMQWDAGPSAGFTTGTPWLPLADDYAAASAAAEDADPRSLLTLYRRLLALRRAEPALAAGPFAPVAVTDAVFAYARTAPEGNRRFIVALNFTSVPQTLRHDAVRGTGALSTHLDRDGERVDGELALRADEGNVVDVTTS